MKKKELERLLQMVASHPRPSPRREQYQTPAAIAADLLFTAFPDIAGKRVVDLGCGTGILAIGASLLGALQVLAVDVDPEAVEQARGEARGLGAEVDFQVSEVGEVEATADTVVMNPPFGAQRGNRGADRRFIRKALEVAPVVYSLHLASTLPFLETLAPALDGYLQHLKNYDFSLPRQFHFHTRRVSRQTVALVRIQRRRR
ncbi:MAG: METTL5 family protein [Thermoplasmatota archaeon]